MLPAIVLGFVYKFHPKSDNALPVSGLGASQHLAGSDPVAEVVPWYRTCANPLLWLGCLGYAGLMATTAGMGYWLVFFLEGTMKVPAGIASSGAGLTTVLASFLGTLMGGRLLDAWGNRMGGKSAAMAYFFCAITALLAVPVYLAGFTVLGMGTAEQAETGLFFLCYGLGIAFTLMAGAVFPLAILWTVRKCERITVSSFFTFVVNCFGTVPAPILVGEAKNLINGDQAPDTYFPLVLMLYISCWMFWPALLGVVVGIACKVKGIGAHVDTMDK